MMIQSDDPLFDHENRRRESSSSLRAQVDALHGALVRAREREEYDSAQLRDAVAAVAKAARDEHVPPERVLVLLKRLTQDDALDHLDEWWRRVLADRSVQWGIEAYYGLPSDHQDK
jgi:hypothetical protein